MTKGAVLKPDADEIRSFIDELLCARWLQPYQNWWPNFVYHSNDVENVARILNHGALLSRNRAIRQGLLVRDCASPGIIAGLTDAEKDWARLYFRPMVPTQYANEGIRPKSQYEYGGAHMPVPAYLLFGSKEVLSLRGTSFTSGRLTMYSRPGIDVGFLRSINFQNVFHDRAFSPAQRAVIVDARQAEVLVKDSLSLDHLCYIGCRSEPESATLAGLLEPDVLERWQDRIILERPDRRLFNKRGTFVEAVDLGPTRSTFMFYSNIGSAFRGPFHVRITWEADDFEGRWERDEFHVTSDPVSFDLGDPQDQYRVRVEFDGNLAYLGTYVAPTEPEVF